MPAGSKGAPGTYKEPREDRRAVGVGVGVVFLPRPVRLRLTRWGARAGASRKT